MSWKLTEAGKAYYAKNREKLNDQARDRYAKRNPVSEKPCISCGSLFLSVSNKRKTCFVCRPEKTPPEKRVCFSCGTSIAGMANKKYCDPCGKQKRDQCHAEYRARNVEAVDSRQKSYYERNKEKIVKQRIEYHSKNPDIAKKSALKYYNKNREELLIKGREWFAKQRAIKAGFQAFETEE